MNLAKDDPGNPKALYRAQSHCEDLLRTGAFPRFLHRATYVNIGGDEIKVRFNGLVVNSVILAVFIPLALTQPWFERSSRFYLGIPILCILGSLQQVFDPFCGGYAVRMILMHMKLIEDAWVSKSLCL